jgi:hypothetical protein
MILYIFFLFIFNAPLCFSAEFLLTPHYFTDREVTSARHFAKHSYLVAQHYDDVNPPADRLEEHVDVAGKNIYSIRGSTGVGPLSYDHVVGAIYRDTEAGGEPNKVYVAFHGSHFFHDWLSDFDAREISAERHGFDGMLHAGFSNVCNSLYASLIRQLRLSVQEVEALGLLPEFVFCGHSLGAAVATIVARQFSSLRGALDGAEPILPIDFNRTLVRLITFSSPPVGDKVFADTYREHIPLALRFHHHGDIVPGAETIFKLIRSAGHIGHPVEILFLEPTSSLVGTAHGRSTLWDAIKELGKPTSIGTAVRSAADVAQVIPRVGPVAKQVLKIGSYVVDGVTRVAPVAIKLMHLVPEEELVLRAFYFEQAKADDDDYKGASWWDYSRNPLFSWFYRKVL